MKIFVLAVFLIVCHYSFSQSIGDFTLTSAYDGASTSLSQYATSSAVVVIFTSNECPFDNYYKTRVKELITAYQRKVQFLLINSNPDTQETSAKMTIHYADLGVPYLTDKDQKVMELFGAKKTPEAFLLKPEGGKFVVAYSGAIDDNPQVASDVKKFYLKDAIEKVITGSKIDVNSNRVAGCTIRKK